MWHSVIFPSSFWLFLYQQSVTQSPIFSDFILSLLGKQPPPINIIYSIFLLTNSTTYKPDLCLAYSPCLSWPFFSFWVLERWDCCKHRCGGMWGRKKLPAVHRCTIMGIQLHSSLHSWIHSYFHCIKPLNIYWRWFPKTKPLLRRCANLLLLPTTIVWDSELGHSTPRSEEVRQLSATTIVVCLQS